MTDRFQITSAVFALLVKDNAVLLLKRANTGWMDGYYDFPAGHLESDETFQEGVVRELEEETGIVVDAEKAELVHIAQSYMEGGKPYFNFFFRISKWSGEPKICEPHRCSDMHYFKINELPENIVPYTKAAIENIDQTKVTFSYHT
jgi:8-oxo-dGTP diphosphatase